MRHFRFALIVFVVWRAVTFALGWYGGFQFPRAAPQREAAQPFGPDSAWTAWCRGDAAQIVAIAERGYDGGERTLAPLYPYAVRALSWLTGNPWVAALLASHIAFLIGLWIAYRLALLKLDKDAARRAVMLIAAFPASYHFATIDSASTLFVTLTAALYFFERRRWVSCAAAALAAALSCDVGAQLLSGRGVALPWEPIARAFAAVDWSFAHRRASDMNMAIALFTAAGLGVAAVTMRRRLGLPYAIVVGALLLLALFADALNAVPRYAATIAPLSMLLASLSRRPAVDRWLLYASSLGLAIATVRYTNPYT